MILTQLPLLWASLSLKSSVERNGALGVGSGTVAEEGDNHGALNVLGIGGNQLVFADVALTGEGEEFWL